GRSNGRITDGLAYRERRRDDPRCARLVLGDGADRKRRLADEQRQRRRNGELWRPDLNGRGGLSVTRRSGDQGRAPARLTRDIERRTVGLSDRNRDRIRRQQEGLRTNCQAAITLGERDDEGRTGHRVVDGHVFARVDLADTDGQVLISDVQDRP